MSSPMKLSLLALVSTAAAIPHYSHSRFHKPSGGYGGPGTGKPTYPTGYWPGSNSTAPLPTGTGVYGDDKTTTLSETSYSTTTLVSTIWVSPKPSGESTSVVGVQDVSSSAAACGPETIYVTATNKVTVTVAAAAPSSLYSSFSVSEGLTTLYSSSSSAGEGYSTSSETPVETPSATETYVVPSSSAVEASSSSSSSSSSSVVEESTTLSIPSKPVETPVETPAASSSSSSSVYVVTPVPSTTEVPSTTAAPSTTSSSATTKPSSPSYTGGKRGLAYNNADLCSAFGDKFTWAYNWASVPGGDLPSGVKYIPMPWGPDKISAEKWLQNVDDAVKSGSDVIKGFNECDHTSQCNMSPAAACQAWTTYMEPVASAHPSVRILGPSVTNGGGEMGLTWLKNFQSGCPSATWHAADIHFYDIYQEGEGQAGTVGRFIAQIEKAAEQTGKKVWVTEFGLNPGATAEQSAKFLKGCMEYMDSSDKVEGYAYFMVGSGENQLNSGTGLSSIGEVYASS